MLAAAGDDNDDQVVVCFELGCFFLVDEYSPRRIDSISLYRTCFSRDRRSTTSGENATCNDMLEKNTRRIVIVSNNLILVRETINSAIHARQKRTIKGVSMSRETRDYQSSCASISHSPLLLFSIQRERLFHRVSRDSFTLCLFAVPIQIRLD